MIAASSLSNEEVELLKNYRFLPKIEHSFIYIEASKLTNSKALRSYLTERLSSMRIDDIKVAASLFIKRYAFLAVIGLFSMSYWNKKMDLSPENVILVDREKHGMWMPCFYLKNSIVTSFSSQEEKHQFLQGFFRQHMDVIIQNIKKDIKLSHIILWENIAVYIFWLYENENFLKEALSQQTVAEDFVYLLQNNNNALFGEYNKNPLARYYTAKVKVEDVEDVVRVRKTCCFSYMLEQGEKNRCNTCPQTCKVRT
jgi:siderophore-iron reductase FhuF